MGFWSRVGDYLALMPDPVVLDVAAGGPNFDIGRTEIVSAVIGASSWDEVDLSGRVSKDQAISVPAVKRARDLICGQLGSLPLRVVSDDHEVTDSALLDQPERNIPRSVTMGRTYEDLLFEGVAWWHIVEQNYRGFPTKVVRLDPRTVDVHKDNRVYVRRDGTQLGSTWEFIPDELLIRFDSPNAPLLAAGGRAIRASIRLDNAAARSADDPMPQGYFTPSTDGDDPAEDDDVPTLLSGWKTARKAGSTAYVPKGLEYKTVQWSPKDIQLIEARQNAALDIARLTGIDPEDLGISTTSRVYTNDQSRKQATITNVLGPYAEAISDRLSMGDVTPRGYRVQVDYNGFLRADDVTRYTAYQLGLDMGLFDLAYVAAKEGLPEPPPKQAIPVQPQAALHSVPQPLKVPSAN